MKRFCIIIYLTLLGIGNIFACTSAIVGAELNPYGRPLLWKNRDTGNLDNKIEYVPAKDGEFGFVALFNSSDSLCKEAWIGMNEYGFAVMNTASYNLKDDNVAQKDMDKEGLIMAKALKSCKTVADFEELLQNYPRPMGVEANFGAIDAYGNGAYFETNNHSFTKYDIKDSPDHILIRTNYSVSGRENEGYGFIREANAIHLLKPFIETKSVTPEVFTENLSRSFYHSLLDMDYSDSKSEWVIDQDFIPRYSSSATIVIEGCKPLQVDEEISRDFIVPQYIMWSGLGYPPCSEILPVWCSENGVDNSLRGIGINGHSEQSDIVMERKNLVFPFKKGNGDKYIHMRELFNEDNTGFVQVLTPQNLQIYSKTRDIRDNN